MMIYRQRRHSHVGRPQVDIVSASYPFYSVYIVDIAMLAIQSIGYRVNIVPLLSSLHRRHRNDRWPTSSRRHRVSIIPLISFFTSLTSQILYSNLHVYHIYTVPFIFCCLARIIVAKFKFATKHISCGKYNFFMLKIAEMNNNNRLVRNCYVRE